MTMGYESIAAARAHNMREFMEHGPGLRYTTATWVVARRPGFIKIGGLGACGVGEMWFPAQPGDEKRLGYAEAVVLAERD